MVSRLHLYWLITCGILVVFLSGAGWTATTFNYTLPTTNASYWTSAAVYNSSNVLVRTLWRHEQKNAGANTASWNNLNDDGGACGAGTYSIKVLYHNVDYQVTGAVGNTSSVRADSPDYWRSFSVPIGMSSSGAAGSPIFLVAGYNEMQTGCKRIDPASPQKATDWFRGDPYTSISKVATDGTNVYLAALGGMQTQKVFVFAISATTVNTFYNFGSFGTDLYLNGDYPDQHYPSVIDLITVSPGPNNDGATGLAVQQSGQGIGDLLAVSHGTLNTVRIYDKTSGMLLNTLSITNPRDVAFASNGDLWVTTGTTIRRYNNLTTTPTLVATVSGLSGPANIATHPSNNTLLVADGETSQQVKAFVNVTSGTVSTPSWTLGQASGWRTNGINAANDKFGFFRTCAGSTIIDAASAMVVLADGSFWVGDTETCRLLHYNSSRSYLERIMFRPASYTATVDTNNPTRMFSDFIEYAVDYSQPMQPGDPEATGGNNCWRFVKNWAAGQETTHADVIYSSANARGLKPVYTLSNGRTYGVVAHSTGYPEVVELAASGLRYTGITLTNTAERIYPDGSRRYISTYWPTGTVTWYTRALTGFDGSGNPQWGTATVLATAPVDARTPNTRASYVHQMQFPVTSNNVLISFDPSSNYAGAGLPYTWHLGGVTVGASSWLWKGSPTVEWEAPFLGVGNFDIGNGTVYAGAMVSAANDQVVYAYTGEFYCAGQASQWMHFMDDGLFVAQFGSPGWPSVIKPIDFAGNIYASEMYTTGGEYYVYANDESNNAGVMLWKLVGANSIAKMVGSGTLNSTITLSNTTSVAPPTFSPAAGSYASPPTVTISTTTNGASIRFTTDGSTPSQSHGTLYSTPVTISDTGTLRAIAYKSGMVDSLVASGTYIITGTGAPVATPTFSPVAGTYSSTQQVAISTATTGATIRYTTDGSDPSQVTGTVYSTPVSINKNITLKAMAYKNGMADSSIASGIYSITTSNFFNVLYTGTRNDATGNMGYEFTMTSTVTVTALGRPVSGTMNGNHYIRLWRVSDQSQLAYVLVTPSSPTDSLGYKYETLGTPVTLNSGTAYRISSSETNGGDAWRWGMSISNHNAVATITCNAWSPQDSYPGNIDGTAEIGSVPPTFYYTNCVTPAFSPVAGAYSSTQQVTISTTTSGATIRYTTNGSTPSQSNGTVYSTPVSISTTTTLKAIAYKTGITDSGIASGIYTINAQVATPTYSPVAGTYSSTQQVAISTTTSGATIRYTTDGTTPSQSNGTVYSTPVSISTTTTLKAIAYKDGMTNSSIASGVYTITGGGSLTNFLTALYTGSRADFTGTLGYQFTPASNITVTALGRPVSGTMNNNHALKIWKVSDQSQVASVTVTPSSQTDSLGYKYEMLGTPVTLTGGTAYRITSYETSGGDAWRDLASISSHSAIASVSYGVFTSGDAYPVTYNGSADTGYVPPTFYTGNDSLVATPTFSPVAGTYSVTQQVTISTTTSGATIRYTTDGSTPSQSVGTVYSTPVSISTTTTLKAIAYKVGMTNSSIASGVYTITGGGSLTNFLTALYTGSRADFTGNLGYQFTPASNITVTALGRPVSGTMNNNHAIRIWKVSDQSQVASVTVTPSSSTDSLGYKYVTLGTPVTLTGGTAYRITSYETSGGDAWRDVLSISSHSAIASVSYGVFASGDVYPSTYNGSADTGYVPPTFYTGDSSVATPTFSPVAGTYSATQQVTISTTTTGATIRYTTDGSTPSQSNGTVYSTPVSISTTTTLKAIAYKAGMTDSGIASGVYTITGGGSLNNFLTALYTGSRADFTGTLGYEFTPSSNITVTALGRPVSGTMNNNHALKIWKVSDHSLVASATVTPSSPTDSLGYKYVTLGTSVTLTGGTVYRITSYETSGGDAWRDLASINSHSAIASVSYGVFSSGDVYPGTYNGSADTGYVPPTFYTN